MTTTEAIRGSKARRRRTPTARPPRPSWSCENCRQVNAGQRRRCSDCGTSRD